MLQDNFIPQKGLNSVFSELINYELVPLPLEEGFLGDRVTLKKRPGLFSDVNAGGVYNRETEGTILGKVIYGGLAFIWDDLGKVYRFSKSGDDYTLTKIYDNDDGAGNPIVTVYDEDSYGNKVKQTAIAVPYLSTLVGSWTANAGSCTNDDGSGNVVLTVNEAGTFTSASVGQYIYFTNSASTNAKYQIRQIVQYISGTEVYLSEQFYSDPTTWAVGEAGETYETIDQVIVFNNLRDSNGLCLTIETLPAAADTYRNLGGLDVAMFEGRWRAINEYGSSVGGSLATGEYEILEPDTVLGSSSNSLGQKMVSLSLFKSYLLISMENGMAVVWQIGTNSGAAPIYNMNTILNGVSPFGPDAITSKDGGMYFIAKDRMFLGGDIDAESTNIIQGITKNQGMVISQFLENIDQDDVVQVYPFMRGLVIQYSNATKTTMLVYDDIYECWLPWEFDGLNIVDKFEPFYADSLICVEDKVCLRRSTSDIGTDIYLKCVVTGSKQIINSQFSLKKIKLMLGYYGNEMDFKITIDFGSRSFQGTISKDANGVAYLTWQNIAGSGGTLGAVPIGLSQLGGVNTVASFIAKVGLLGIPIGKRCTYYKITLENIDNSDLNIVGISALVEEGNPYITPLQNVF